MLRIVKILRLGIFIIVVLMALVYGIDFLNAIASPNSFAALGGAFKWGIRFTVFGGLAVWIGIYVISDIRQHSLRYSKQLADQQAQRRQQEAEAVEKMRREAPERERIFREMFDNKLNIVQWTSNLVEETDDYKENDEYITIRMSFQFEVSRSLSSMKDGEVEILRYLYLLRNYELMSADDYQTIKLGYIYNGGNCQLQVSNYFISRGFVEKHGIKNDSDAVRYVINRWKAGTLEVSKALFFRAFSGIEGRFPDHPIVRECRSKLLGGSDWFSEQAASSVFIDWRDCTTDLFLGETDSGRRIGYRKDGSLVSIAPPGSGKTLCHVIPNLLSYKGPVVVLDVKGECFENTAAWRKKHVGPVFKFNPLDVKGARYNPLTHVIDKQDDQWENSLWQECRLMADLLIVPQDRNNPTWESRAQNVVTGVIAWLLIRSSPEERSMGKVIDVVNKVGWKDFVEYAQIQDDCLPLRRLGNALADMPEKQLEGVLDAARRHLAVWEGGHVETVTGGKCDWKPEDLRNGSNPTVYICIPPTEIDSYAPLLRVLFAQHLRRLMHTLPVDGQPPILFMLDELPRLGAMKPVEEALESGRGYGIKLWMFAQSLGQFKQSYTNADGMVGSCAVRLFMNPSAADGTAKQLSEELGYRESIVDGSRHLMVEPTELTTGEYKDYQIALAINERPAKLKRVYFESDSEFEKRSKMN
jgi:type IV secretion system protein VirD4